MSKGADTLLVRSHLKADRDNLWCTYCEKPRHPRERCWILHGKHRAKIGVLMERNHRKMVRSNMSYDTKKRMQGRNLELETLTNRQKRDNYEELALALWHSNLTATILLQEVLGGYRLLEQTKVSKMETDRVCNALTLFMRVAQYRETRIPFLRAKIPEYLYPFLNATQTGQHIEFLKFSSLSVLVSLVQDNDPEAVHFLLETEVFPKCLRCMEHGSETTKILATRVISKILTQEEGVLYCCDHKVRFYSVANVMAGIVDGIEQGVSPLLLKHIIDCYLRFSTDHRAAVALKQILPENLTNPSFINMMLLGQVVAMEKLNQLLYNINIA